VRVPARARVYPPGQGKRQCQLAAITGCLTVSDIRQHITNAEAELLRLKRKLTDTIVAKRATGNLSTEIARITEARDFFRARLERMEGTSDGRRQDQDWQG
jgi:hypothetical protein